MKYLQLPYSYFKNFYAKARYESQRIAEATSPADELDAATTYYISNNGRSGYGIQPDGTLIAVFSLDKGQGRELVRSATGNGAYKLDCFDGYLVGFYEAQGFRILERCANWTQGEPDVVFMTRD